MVRTSPGVNLDFGAVARYQRLVIEQARSRNFSNGSKVSVAMKQRMLFT
jgi:hypothetical protein